MKVKVLFSPIVRNQCKILVCCGLPFEKDASLAKGEWIFGGDSEDEEEEEWWSCRVWRVFERSSSAEWKCLFSFNRGTLRWWAGAAFGVDVQLVQPSCSLGSLKNSCPIKKSEEGFSQLCQLFPSQKYLLESKSSVHNSSDRLIFVKQRAFFGQ